MTWNKTQGLKLKKKNPDVTAVCVHVLIGLREDQIGIYVIKLVFDCANKNIHNFVYHNYKSNLKSIYLYVSASKVALALCVGNWDSS